MVLWFFSRWQGGQGGGDSGSSQGKQMRVVLGEDKKSTSKESY